MGGKNGYVDYDYANCGTYTYKKDPVMLIIRYATINPELKQITFDRVAGATKYILESELNGVVAVSQVIEQQDVSPIVANIEMPTTEGRYSFFLKAIGDGVEYADSNRNFFGAYNVNSEGNFEVQLGCPALTAFDINTNILSMGIPQVPNTIRVEIYDEEGTLVNSINSVDKEVDLTSIMPTETGLYTIKAINVGDGGVYVDSVYSNEIKFGIKEDGSFMEQFVTPYKAAIYPAEGTVGSYNLRVMFINEKDWTIPENLPEQIEIQIWTGKDVDELVLTFTKDLSDFTLNGDEFTSDVTSDLTSLVAGNIYFVRAKSLGTEDFIESEYSYFGDNLQYNG